ncbi:MAG: hypothetical protein D6791_14785 [Chloroflexi bacterium]|nr:MAG: hypothetical protein D6791_14785 [Chloroflexota bacterium]
MLGSISRLGQGDPGHGDRGAQARREKATLSSCHPLPPSLRLPPASAPIEAVYTLIEDVIGQADLHPAFQAALRQRIRPPDGPQWLHLPLLCCQAVGGPLDQGLIVAAAFELARLAANVLDDVEDADGADALWRSMGIPQAINVGTSLIFASLMALSRLRECGARAETIATIQAEFARTGFRMCEGQHLDLGGGAEEQGSRGELTHAPWHLRASALLRRYWQIAAAKSGAFFELGCRAGVLLCDVSPQDLAPYAEYGWHLGLLIQIANDLAGLLDERDSSDVVYQKMTLPVLYALSVATPAQARQLRQAWTAAAQDARARREVSQMVVELGAPQYIFVEAERHYWRARQALERANGQTGALAQLADFLNLQRPASFLSETDANPNPSRGESRC